MKLWGGRFTKETNKLVDNFNASLPFDKKFYKEDIEEVKSLASQIIDPLLFLQTKVLQLKH